MAFKCACGRPAAVAPVSLSASPYADRAEMWKTVAMGLPSISRARPDITISSSVTPHPVATRTRAMPVCEGTTCGGIAGSCNNVAW